MSRRTIWKYSILPNMNTINVPSGAKPLSVAFQGQELMVWLLVDPDASKVDRTFAIYGTGHIIPEGREIGVFLGTTVHPTFGYVIHVFDLGEA